MGFSMSEPIPALRLPSPLKLAVDRSTLFALAALIVAVVPSAAQADDTIVVLGDSNAAGFGVGTDQAFPAKMQQMLQKRGRHVRVVNAGVSGDTFGGMANRVDSVPAGAKTVIVQGGYNDLAMGVPPEQSIANMRRIVSKLRGRGSNVVLCGFFRPKWDAIGRKVAAQYGARFVPGSTCYDPRHRGMDGLHMSASGHQVVAGRLSAVVGGGGRAVAKKPRKAKRKG